MTSPDRPEGPRLNGRLAVVTGGGRGLGKALVEALAQAGADVAFSHRESREGARDVARDVESRGRRAFTARADARRPGEMAAFVDQAASALGGIDLLVNNVGVFRKTPLQSLEEEALDEAFAVNVKAAVMASKAATPHMRRRGGGAIVNVASLGGLRPWRSHLPYCATKAALIMATKCLALALGPEIRVNAVAPGILDPPGASEAVRERVPMKRFGRVAEAVEAVLFLLAGATYSTGAVLAVDGGRQHF
ncbi:MAG TPA: SDR family oxidoreductase [Vicinamibacteria bacterium]|nr:SDR family oxidoreductase [Vicinamibacteria bacterium]